MRTIGRCQDPDCEYPHEPTELTGVAYTATAHGPSQLCDGCLENWQDAQQSLEANRQDMSELGFNTGDVFQE